MTAVMNFCLAFGRGGASDLVELQMRSSVPTTADRSALSHAIVAHLF